MILSEGTFRRLQKDPIFAMTILMPGMELPTHQAIIIKQMWTSEYIYSSSGRSTGKTALTGIFLALWCATHPGTKVLCVGLKFRTSCNLILFMEGLLAKYPMLAACAVTVGVGNYVVHGADQWKLAWKNESIVLAVPADLNKKGARVRGLRCSIIVIDEIAQIPPEIVRQAFLPCCSIRDAFGFRRVIRLSTAGTKPSEAWDDCRKHFLHARALDKAYSFHNFNYLDVDPKFSYIIDRAAIAEMEADAPPDEVQREIYGNWTACGGNYYQAGLLERNRMIAIENEVFPETSGTPGGVYIIGVDPAFSGTDETAVVVIKKFPKGKWGIVLSYAVNFKAGWAQKNAALIEDLIHRFDPIYIGMDKNGGEQLLEQLTHSYEDNPRLCPINMENENFDEGREIVRLFAPSGSGKDSNTRLNSRLLRALDGNGDPTLLMPGAARDEEGHYDQDQIDKLMVQLINVKSTALEQPGLFKFSSSMKKDRFSALLYGWNAVEELAMESDDWDGAAGGSSTINDDVLVF